MAKNGLSKHTYKNQHIALYKQSGKEKIGIFALDGLHVHNITDIAKITEITDPKNKNRKKKIRVKCVMNCHYFINNTQAADYGQILGRCQSFDRDSRTIGPQDSGFVGWKGTNDKDIIDLVVDNEGNIHFGNFNSWDWMDNVMFGVAPAGIEYDIANGIDVNNYQYSPRLFKENSANTQSLLLKFEDGTFGLAAVTGSLTPLDCVDWTKSVGGVHQSCYDSGGSTQMIANGEIIRNTGRKVPSFFMIYEDIEEEIPPTLEGGSIIGLTDSEYTGAPITFTHLIIKDQSGKIVAPENYTIEYQNNIEVGSATIKIIGRNQYSGTIIQHFSIIKADISKASIQNVLESQVYTGQPIICDNLIIQNSIGTILQINQDYTIEYKNNINVSNIEKAKIIITGQNNYTNQKIIEFNITPKNIGLTSFSGYNTEVIYTSKPIIFNNLIVKDGTTILHNNVDYEVIYENNINVSKNGHIIIKGKGNYNSESSIRFTILPCSLNNNCTYNNLPDSVYIYDGLEKTPSNLLNNTDIVHNSTQEHLQYKKDYILLSAAKIINTGKYQINIKGVNNYNGMDIILNLEIIPDQFEHVDIFVPNNEFIYEGNAIELPMQLIYKGVGVSLDDYDVKYLNNNGIGTAQAIVTGKRNFKGEQIIDYYLVEKPTIEILNYDKNVLYQGQPITFPNLIVKLQGIEVQDYIIQYFNNINVTNDAYFEISFPKRPELKNTKRTFNILPIDLSSGSFININDWEKEYDGQELDIPFLIFQYNNIIYPKIQNNIDYTISCSNADLINAGEKELIITPLNNNYTGKYQVTLNINRKYFSETAILKNVQEEMVYTALDITFPDLQIEDNGILLKENQDYKTTYYNNHDASESSDQGYPLLLIEGINNYRGYIYYHFTIKKFILNDMTCFIDNIPQNLIYTGQPISFHNTGNFSVSTEKYRLFFDQDIRIKYYNNINVHDDSYFVIEGINNYTGTVKRSFKIHPKDIATLEQPPLVVLVSATSWFIYDGLPKIYDGTLVQINNEELFYQEDYSIKYYNNINATTPNNMAIIEFIFNNNYKGTWQQKFSIDPEELNDNYYSILFKNNNITYTGQPIEFSDLQILINDGAETPNYLEKNKDYDIEYFNNVNVNDNSYVLIKGKNNYIGTLQKTFTIKPYSLNNSDITYHIDMTEFNYDGQNIDVVTNNVHVYQNQKLLKLNKDYTIISNTTIQSIGSYSIYIRGINNYTGQIIQDIRIIPTDLQKVSIVNFKKAMIFNNDFKTQKDVQLKFNNLILQEGIDYILRYENNSNCGSAKMIAIGKGNFTGQIEKIFTIIPAPLTENNLQINPLEKSFHPVDEIWYNTAIIEVRYNGYKMYEQDYDINIESIENESENRKYDIVSIIGKGNYVGTVSQRFKTGILHEDTPGPNPNPGMVTLEDRKSGYTYIQYNNSMSGLFTISSQGKSAMDELNQQLYNHAYGVETINITCVPIYHLSLNSRIFVRDDDSDINGEYIVTAISIPLSANGMMNISAVKAVKPIY